MKRLIFFIMAFSFLAFIHPAPVQAIIIIPPLIALSLIKLVALIIGAASVPTSVFSAVAASFKSKNRRHFYKLTLLYSLVGLTLIGSLSFLVLKLIRF